MVTEKSKANLRVPSSIEARKNGKKGGIASAESRRATKTMKEVFKELMDDETRLKLAQSMLQNGMGGNAAVLKMALQFMEENPDADSITNHNIVVQLPNEMNEYSD